MSEQLERMLAGKLYDPSDAELAALRLKAHKLSRQYNNTDEDEEKLRAEILRQLTPNAKPGLFLQGPVYFDYGVFTSFGRNCYANFNFTVLDCCPVTIGDDVFFGPNCSLLTPMHSFLSAERNIRTRLRHRCRQRCNARHSARIPCSRKSVPRYPKDKRAGQR